MRLSDLFSKKDDEPVADEPLAQKEARADLLWKQGVRLMERRKYPQAVESLRDAMQLEPSRLEGRLNLGAALYMTQGYEEAITHLRYVLAFEPQNAMALLNLAACYDALGRMDESIEALESLIEDRPTWRDAHYNLAVAYYKRRLFDKAEAALKAELKLNPEHETARTLLNKIYILPHSQHDSLKAEIAQEKAEIEAEEAEEGEPKAADDGEPPLQVRPRDGEMLSAALRRDEASPRESEDDDARSHPLG